MSVQAALARTEVPAKIYWMPTTVRVLMALLAPIVKLVSCDFHYKTCGSQ